MTPGSVRGVVADALSLTAAVMGMTSRVAERAASLLRGERSEDASAARQHPSRQASREERSRPGPPPRQRGGGRSGRPSAAATPPRDAAPPEDETPPGPVDAERLGEDLDEQAADRRPGEPPPVAPQPALPEDAPAHVREPDTHAGELAARPIDDIVARVGDLSTDELRALYEHESSHDRREPVLRAIERALTP